MLDRDIVAGIRRREPEVDFELPQGLIPEGMKDPEVLAVSASAGRILVTHDVRTMPRHFGEFTSGRACPGLILIPRSVPIAQAIEEILLIWHISEAEEWTNCLRWGSKPETWVRMQAAYDLALVFKHARTIRVQRYKPRTAA